MGIKQFNGEWLPQEDRVRLRFNTDEGEEYSFWLTRRIVAALLVGTQQTAVKTLEKTHAPQVAQAVQAFQQEVAVQQANFQEAYHPAPQQPLGAEPLLVIGLAIRADEAQVAVEFQLITGNSVHIQVPPHVVQVMATLLSTLQAKAEWGVGSGVMLGEPVLTNDAPPRLMH